MKCINKNILNIKKINYLHYHALELNKEINKILMDIEDLLPDIASAIEGIELDEEEIKKAHYSLNNGTAIARRKAEKFLKSKGVL